MLKTRNICKRDGIMDTTEMRDGGDISAIRNAQYIQCLVKVRY